MSYWQKQTQEEAVFPTLRWSRPENRQYAGKLLIVGGNQYGFAAAGEAYAAAQQAGVGVSRVLLPDALQKTVGKRVEGGEFAPSTPSGSFSQKALQELLSLGSWADGVMFAGDLGRNSETAILLEKFLDTHQGMVCLTKDAADYVTSMSGAAARRNNTILVLSFAQLQRLGIRLRFPHPFTFQMGLLQLVTTLHDLTKTYPCSIVVKYLDQIVVACDGAISTTRLTPAPFEIWRVRTAAYVLVWAIQSPTQVFAALTTGVYEVVQGLS